MEKRGLRVTLNPKELYHVTAYEYVRGGIDWFPRMSPKAAVLIDATRLQWAMPIWISADDGALGRVGDQYRRSQHWSDRPGGVGAIDHIPAGIETAEDAERYVYLLCSMGWTGYGFYPFWSSGPGFHADVRTDRKPLKAATWGRVLDDEGQVQKVSLREAVDWFDAHGREGLH